MAGKQSKNNPYIPTEAREKTGNIGTQNITEGKDTGSWFMNEDGEVDNSRTIKEMVKDFNEAKGYDQPEPLEGASGTIARGNQGDNAIANPDAPDTADVTKKHNEELAQLQNAIGDTSVVTGSIPTTESITEDVTPEETVNTDGETSKESTTENSLNKAPEDANLDFSEYIKNYYGPKNGADYLKSLWAQGAGGKAKAVGNVLGNLMGKLGTINVAGAQGQGRDYTSDWENYTNNYQKALAERNQQAFDQNMGIANQLRTNDVARGEMLKALDQYAKIGKNMDPEKFENIRKALTATGNSSQAEYYLASALGDLTSDPEFMSAVKGAGENATQLLSNLTQFGANTLRPLNYVFGGGWK